MKELLFDGVRRMESSERGKRMKKVFICYRYNDTDAGRLGYKGEIKPYGEFQYKGAKVIIND